MTAWRREQRRDRFFRRAKREGYRTRSAYKLTELSRLFRLLRRGYVVLDLGAAPGGWSQIAVHAVGESGRVVAVDLQEIDPIPGVTTIQGDIGDDETIEAIHAALGGQADAVISDVAPQISGVIPTDHARSIELAVKSLSIALEVLKPGGDFAVKLFRGEDFDRFVLLTKRYFKTVRTHVPEATRQESREMYVLGFALKENDLVDPDVLLAAIPGARKEEPDDEQPDATRRAPGGARRTKKTAARRPRKKR